MSKFNKQGQVFDQTRALRLLALSVIEAAKRDAQEGRTEALSFLAGATPAQAASRRYWCRLSGASVAGLDRVAREIKSERRCAQSEKAAPSFPST